MQLHHTSTVPPGARPVRFNRRGNPPFAAVPIDDTTSVLVESAAEARDMVARFAQAAEFLESLESLEPQPQPREVHPAVLAEVVETNARLLGTLPTCARCGDSQFVAERGGQVVCWESAHCADRAEARHAQEAGAR